MNQQKKSNIVFYLALLLAAVVAAVAYAASYTGKPTGFNKEVSVTIPSTDYVSQSAPYLNGNSTVDGGLTTKGLVVNGTSYQSGNTTVDGGVTANGGVTVGATGTLVTLSKAVTVDVSAFTGQDAGVAESSIEDITMAGVSASTVFVVSMPEAMAELGYLCSAFYHNTDQIGVTCWCHATANCADPGAVNVYVRAFIP